MYCGTTTDSCTPVASTSTRPVTLSATTRTAASPCTVTVWRWLPASRSRAAFGSSATIRSPGLSTVPSASSAAVLAASSVACAAVAAGPGRSSAGVAARRLTGPPSAARSPVCPASAAGDSRDKAAANAGSVRAATDASVGAATRGGAGAAAAGSAGMAGAASAVRVAAVDGRGDGRARDRTLHRDRAAA